MSYDKIPQELRNLIQWCVWKYETTDTGKQTKVPYNPLTGKKVSSTDRQTWVSFEQATEALKTNWGYNGLGFVFSDNDPYCGIDLDATEDPEISARQQKIFETFDSYAERSPSGKGLHIIIKASVPGGRKRDCVEIYSTARFFTMTGNVYRDAPINNHHWAANKMWSEMAPKDADIEYEDQEQRVDDDEIINIAASAANGEKFTDLFNGNWQGYYNSQSEADLALVDIINYYSRNEEQTWRLFKRSGLGKRKKAERDNYVRPMIKKSFDNMPPPVDLSEFKANMERALASAHNPNAGASGAPTVRREAPGGAVEHSGALSSSSPAPALPAPQQDTPRAPNPFPFDFDPDYFINNQPPGVIQQITDYVYHSSPRPVYIMALMSAIGLVTGVVGRQYNVSSTGLNQYFMVIAHTGKGKEAIKTGMSRVVSAVMNDGISSVRVAGDFLGPAEIASGQALLKHIADREMPCFITLTGEFGMRLKQITDENASAADRTLLRVMLDLYSKSGKGQRIEPYIYSDKKNNTDVIHSPSFTMLGESTPEIFYEALNESTIASGLLPRFTIVEYNGPRTPFNKSHGSVEVPAKLKQDFGYLVAHVHHLANIAEVPDIGATPEATEFLDTLNNFCDNQINMSGRDVMRQLWNRVHLKVLKLAGVLAVSKDYNNPIIDYHMVKWAVSLVVTDTLRLISKYEKGDLGNVDPTSEREGIIRKLIYDYMTKDPSNLPKNIKPDLHAMKLIERSYIQQMLHRNKAFSTYDKDRRSSTINVNNEIDNLINNGVLAKLGFQELKRIGKERAYILSVVDMTWLMSGS